eukprot:TRINITY_DN3417_c0_g1_i8.p1 TRINITY_DN3417_c0_g1~~TRINITY_DN3417_c0_g1_i8.p1  ORF type:complete len:613 (-),score=166.41 TRINITY_DN3417_c0_g1_i8:334-2172(-)
MSRAIWSIKNIAARANLLGSERCFSTSSQLYGGQDSPAWRSTPTQMTSSEAFTETLVANGLTNIFGIVGSAFMDALDIFPAAGIRFVSVQHEQNATHMADGYSRVTNKPSACIAQNGPGITNFVTGVAAAYWAHSPVVVITPETGSLTNGLGGFQETNQLPIFSEITKYQAHVVSPKRMAEFTNRCFHYAMMERGPVQLNIPRDMFYGDVVTTIPPPLVIEKSAGGPAALQEATELLAGAKNPVIVSGGGVVMADGVAQVQALAEALQIPVCSTYLHNDSFPADHPLWMGPLGYQGSKAAMNTISKADVVLAIGTRLGPFGALPQYGFDYWPKDAKIIQVESNARRLGLTKKIDVGILGDAKLTSEALLAKLQGASPACLDNKGDRLSAAKLEKEKWEAELDAMSVTPAGQALMEPRHALRELEKAMPDNAMVSTDIGNICSVSNSYLRFKNPNSFFAAMSFGNCGYAFPCAMGAKLGAPDRPAIAYVGDGAWGMSLNEIMTCVRENIPAIAVVFNNGQWGAEKKNQVDFYGDRYVGTNIQNPSFAEVSRVMGAEGIKVDKPEEVGAALKTLIASGKPGVLEIMVSKTLADPFRRDALSKPIRHLDKYKTFV